MLEGSIGTNQLLVDTDGDNLSDFHEVDYDGVPAAYNPVSDLNPLSTDTDGDVAPLGSPDGVVNAADFLVMQLIVLGIEQATAAELVHGDLYPVGEPDGVINLSDLLLLFPLLGW